MRKVLLFILMLGIIGAGVGYYMYNKPVASLEKKKPEVEVTASQLLADYETDETKANEMYLGKLVQVSGKVASITDEAGVVKILLEISNPLSSITCELETGMEIGPLKPGDDVIIKGSCTGYQSLGDMGDVILVQSSIVN